MRILFGAATAMAAVALAAVPASFALANSGTRPALEPEASASTTESPSAEATESEPAEPTWAATVDPTKAWALKHDESSPEASPASAGVCPSPRAWPTKAWPTENESAEPTTEPTTEPSWAPSWTPTWTPGAFPTTGGKLSGDEGLGCDSDGEHSLKSFKPLREGTFPSASPTWDGSWNGSFGSRQHD